MLSSKIYALSKKARGLPVLILDGIAGVSGIAWCLWIIGFVLFFVAPSLWVLSLFLAACGLLLKVASKVGLIGLLMKEQNLLLFQFGRLFHMLFCVYNLYGNLLYN